MGRERAIWSSGAIRWTLSATASPVSTTLLSKPGPAGERLRYEFRRYPAAAASAACADDPQGDQGDGARHAVSTAPTPCGPGGMAGHAAGAPETGPAFGVGGDP